MLIKIGIIVLLIVLLTGAICAVVLGMENKKNRREASEKTLDTLSAWTDCKVFQQVPSLQGEDTQVGEAVDYGYENYVIDINGVTMEEYQKYVLTMGDAGFIKHSDNGKNGMDGYVYTASFQKDDLTITLSYIARESKLYVSGAYDLALSDHLIYKEEYKNGISDSAKTTLSLMELNDNGNSFVIQLRNGHFIINDGGVELDAPYLIDYLESLTPEGQKPVIEAWFITHAHSDHYGAIWRISSDINLKDRLIVNGVYFTEPNINTTTWGVNPTQNLANCRLVASAFQTEDGAVTALYRPQIGQKYYFCDIVIDVLLTTEQLPFNSYNSDDLNDTSIWLMHHIEGQKVLIAGDANKIAMRKVMQLYDSDYFHLDVMGVFHHGINVYDFFTEYISVDTLLYTSFRAGSMYTDGTWREAKEANINLQNAVKEYYHRGDGTVVLTFPYTVGSAQVLAGSDWRYNETPGKPERSGWGE